MRTIFMVLLVCFVLIPEHTIGQIDFENFDQFKAEKTAYFDSLRDAGQDPNGYGAKLFQKQMRLWGETAEADGDILESLKAMSRGENLRATYGNCTRSVEWRELGPFSNQATNSITNTTYTPGSTTLFETSSGVGRIHFLEEDPNNPNRLFCGSGTGGLFVSENGGDSWTVTGTDEHIEMSGAQHFQMDHDPLFSNYWYIIVGEDQFTFSRGVYRSSDAGITWEPINTGLPIGNFTTTNWNTDLHQLMINPFNGNELLVACNEGVFRTVNARSANPTWHRVTDSLGYFDIYELEYVPGTNFQHLYASGDRLIESTDGGANWSFLTTENQLPIAGRTTLIDIQKINGQTEIVVSCRESLSSTNFPGLVYRWNNSSSQWQFIDKAQTRWHSFAMSPLDANMIFGMGYDTLHFLNSSGQFVDLQQFTRRDGLWISFSNDGQTVWVGTDGGLFKSDDLGLTWQNKTIGLGVSNTEKFGIASKNPRKISYGGFDVGSSVKCEDWLHIAGGDAYETAINDKNQNVEQVFSTQQWIMTKTINCTQSGGNNNNMGWLPNFNTTPIYYHKFALSPQDLDVMYIPQSTEVHRSFNAAASWEPISDNASINLGGCPPREWRATWTDRSNPNVVYAFRSGAIGTNPNMACRIDAYRLFKTSNALAPSANVTWTDVTPSIPTYDAIKANYPEKGPLYIRELATSKDRPNEIWIATAGVLDGKPKVLHYDGSIWTDITGEDNNYENANDGPLTGVEVFSIAKQENSSRVYIGTSHGVWYKDDVQTEWCRLSGIPKARVTEIEIHECGGIIVASTFGRGIWEADLLPNEHEIVIQSPTTWGSPREINGTVVIQPGAVLTITSTVDFTVPSKVIVRPGARLVVNGGTLTNSCSSLWRGIFVEGQSGLPQAPFHQGMVIVRNGATIENALNAIRLIGLDANGNVDWNSTGGFVKASNSTFRNNWRAIEFMGYHNIQNGTEFNNLSSIVNCEFITEGQVADGRSPFAFISLSDVRGVLISGNTFINSALQRPEHPGIGIISIGANYRVSARCTVALPVGQSCPQSNMDKNIFKNLFAGVANYQGGNVADVLIEDAIFENCTYGVRLEGSSFSRVDNSTFKIPIGSYDFPYSGSNFGVFTDNAQFVKIEGCDFQNDGQMGNGDGRNLGVSAENQTISADVYRNEFTDLETQVQARGNNDQLQIDCNSFTRNSSNTVSDIHMAGAPLAQQGYCSNEATEPQANVFSGPCSITNWQMFTNNNLSFTYFSHSSTGIQYSCLDPFPDVDYQDCITQNLSDACPVLNSKDNPGDITVPSDLLENYSMLLANLDNLYQNIDNGNTDQLLSDVYTQSCFVKQTLIDNGPLISDAVLLAYLEQNCSALDIAQVIVGASPVTTTVMQTVQGLNLPAAIMTQIEAAQTGTSPMHALLEEINAVKHKKLVFLSEIIRLYLSAQEIDNALNLLGQDGSWEASMMALPIAMQNHQAEYSNHINALRSKATDMENANDTRRSDHINAFCDFYDLVKTISINPGGLYELTSQQRSDLESVALSNAPISANARGILNFIDESVEHTDALPYLSLKSARVELPNDHVESGITLTNKPNPFESFTTITGHIDRTFSNAKIVIYDLAGRTVGSYNVGNSEFTVDVDLSSNESGIYTYSLIIDGVVAKTQKMVVQ